MQVAEALRLLQMPLVNDPAQNVPIVDAATFASEVAGNLIGVEQLYAQHCDELSQKVDDCPARELFGRLVEDIKLSSAGKLLQAASINPGSARWYKQLADALERISRFDLAVLYRRRAQGLEADSLDDVLTAARLLDLLGHSDEAAVCYRDLAIRWPLDSETKAQLKLSRHHGYDEKSLPATRDALSQDGGESEASRSPECLAVLAWAVAGQGLLRIDDKVCQDIMEAAWDVVERFGRSSAAHLARGYAALGLGYAEEAKRRFSTALLLWRRTRDASQAAGPLESQLTAALTFAHAYIRDPRVAERGRWFAPTIEEPVLVLAHAKELICVGDFSEAMRIYKDFAAGYFVSKFPQMYEFYRDYKILLHEKLYYAIPRHVRDFTIVDGIVCRKAAIAQYARYRLPRWMITLARRYVERGSRSMPLVARVIRLARLRLYAVPGVKVADDIETLRAEIDQSQVQSVL